MSKKSSQPQSQTPPPPGGGVDFLVRTMIEREATGKRPIRPKNVEDLLQSTIADESDDPDFDFHDEDSDSDGSGSNDSDDDGSNADDTDGDDDDESDDEEYQGKAGSPASSSGESHDASDKSDSSSNESSDSESDATGAPQKSALRETLQKLNEESNFMAKRPTKKRRKAAKSTSKKSNSKSTVGKSNVPKTAKLSTKAKSNDKSIEPKSKQRQSKIAKAKKVLASKKSKSSTNKHLAVDKRKRKKEKGKNRDENIRSKRSIRSLIQSTSDTLKENRKELEGTKPICSACLGDKSDDSNEVVECDSCGISVHEICYGLSSDNISISSGSGSSSCTEPWFCDVCKSNAENISCELCPVEGGLFKESTAGRWVHLVCAMYTQGVALHHDSSINLFEIQYAKWGSHSCAACEDERKAPTGIVISCDAGMCKTYFHATCAQKLGLLSDPNQVDFAEADPYYVSCKMHTNQETRKRRVKLFNTLQEQLRIKRQRKELNGLPSEATADHARILRKLEKVRQKTATKRANYLSSMENVLPTNSSSMIDQVGHSDNQLPLSWINGNKKQRFMHTSAKLGNAFVRKVDRLGENIVAHELEVKHEKIIANVKRKWNVLPAMSVEYAAYYGDRENRISALVDQREKSLDENRRLMEKEVSLKEVWEMHSVNEEVMEEETKSVSQQLQSLVNIVLSVHPGDKKLSTKLQGLARPKELAAYRRKSPNAIRGDRKSPTPRRSSTASYKKSQKNRVLSPSPSRAGKMAIAVCATCAKSDNQHLITRCDKCKKHYHLRCLDPPLTRMPKRSRLCGWMCSDCCDAPSDEEGQVDTEAPRTLRGRTKIHKPRKYRGSDDSEDDTKSPDLKTTPKKSKQNSSNTIEVEKQPQRGDSLVGSEPSPRNSTSPSGKRRRNISADLSSFPSSPFNSPNPIVNGPTMPSDFLTPNPTSSILTGVASASPEAFLVTANASKSPKRKKSASPKRAKGSAVANVEISDVNTETIKTEGSVHSSTITFHQVNGFNDSSAGSTNIQVEAQTSKKTRKKRKRESNVNEESEIPGINNVQAGVILPKPKGKRKKNDTSTVATTNELASKGESPEKTAVPKQKRPRANKKKKVASNAKTDSHLEAIVGSSNGSELVPKQKKSRVRKSKSTPDGTLVVEDGISKNGLIPASTTSNTISSVVDMVIPPLKIKKRKKKKDIEATSELPGENISETTETNKKPRKKKVKKADQTNSESIEGMKVKKKPAKSSIVPTTQATNSAREEKNDVNLVMEKVTSQFMVDKLKGIKSGPVKSKKRKNASALGTNSTSGTSLVTSTPDEKEKSVPPKKRKRASSSTTQNQLQGHNSSIDSVIESVIQGNSNPAGSENRMMLGNGSLNSQKSSEVSTIMQGINRQIRPEQNLMQGKAMGSGVSSLGTEMVTVDASFLIDGASSGQPNYCMNSSVPTFYASSNNQNIGAAMDEGGILKLSGMGHDNTSNSNENVIRLQYIDQGIGDTSAATDSLSMPPPAPPLSSPGTFTLQNGVCATCTKTDNKVQLVMCDKCQLEYHFMCLNPPSKNSPRKKGLPWFCSDCDDNETHVENGIVRHVQ